MAFANTDQANIKWEVARTRAHLHINGNYCGISVAIGKCQPSDETLKALNLPPLPKKGG